MDLQMRVITTDFSQIKESEEIYLSAKLIIYINNKEIPYILLKNIKTFEF